ncbi:hypothetical protein EES39_29345 [Streptomyces sp. ADI92-24]|nr:hypothetical protein EES39_29345 [Streptomyces sp. ADI92-24]
MSTSSRLLSRRVFGRLAAGVAGAAGAGAPSACSAGGGKPSDASTDRGGLMAAATLITVPVVLAALLGQKHLVAGLTSGATKG